MEVRVIEPLKVTLVKETEPARIVSNSNEQLFDNEVTVAFIKLF